jgi:hypothetical protein
LNGVWVSKLHGEPQLVPVVASLTFIACSLVSFPYSNSFMCSINARRLYIVPCFDIDVLINISGYVEKGVSPK